MAERGVLVVVD